MDKNNFFWLLPALLIFLIGVPVADELAMLSEPAVRALLFSCLLAIGIWSLRGAGHMFSVGLAFVIAGILSNILAVKLTSPAFSSHPLQPCLVFFWLPLHTHPTKSSLLPVSAETD